MPDSLSELRTARLWSARWKGLAAREARDNREYRKPTIRLSNGAMTNRAAVKAAMRCEFSVGNDVAGELLAQLEQSEAEVASLRALLREYGRHQEGCSAVYSVPGGAQYRCRCGWDEARKELEGK